MSTFMGLLHEFPDIRIDYFCDLVQRPALACFLSHVHSDHLKGLQTLKSPFVYCSPATREILLRLEKIPSRLNYAQGITEKRNPTYKDLEKIVKPLPLETPVVLELKPGLEIQVTLLDANHCVGAVMFLVEGDGKAVLYTGDIRSEPWWVNAIARSPCMVEYSSGLKRLDRIYLDTSTLDDFHLQTKAEGLRELLVKVAQYPDNTVFHFQAWTYGYEEVWIALAKALQSKIHVDDYKMRIYKSLISATKSTDTRFPILTPLAKEAPYLVGFSRGNSYQGGCLTHDEDARIHSCEKGTGCSVMEKIEHKPVVWIRPIVAHLQDGQYVAEVGIGGGGDDLIEKPPLQDITVGDIENLVKMSFPEELQEAVKGFLLKNKQESSNNPSTDPSFMQALPSHVIDAMKLLSSFNKAQNDSIKQEDAEQCPIELPNRIIFPYARHSSLPELRHLVQTLKPKDIWPCTFDFANWERKGFTIQNLFGDQCSGDTFAHDRLMDQMRDSQRRDGFESNEPDDTQRTASSRAMTSSPVLLSGDTTEFLESSILDDTTTRPGILWAVESGTEKQSSSQSVQFPAGKGGMEPPLPPAKRNYEAFQDGSEILSEADEEPVLQDDSQASIISTSAYEIRLDAFRAAESMIAGDGWCPIGLISTTDHHTVLDEDIGA